VFSSLHLLRKEGIMCDCILFSVLVWWNVKLQDEMYGEVSKIFMVGTFLYL